MDTWHDVGQVFKSVDKVKKRGYFCRTHPIPARKPWEIKRENKEKSKTSFDDPRSSDGWNLSSQELKFIYLTRATHVYQKRGISPKTQMRRFGEIKVFGFMRFSRDLLPFYYAPRGRGSSYFGLFLTLRLF